MAQLTVRDVPDEVVAALRAEAESLRLSLNSVIVAAIRDYEDKLRRRRALQAGLPLLDVLHDAILRRRDGEQTSDSAELLHADQSLTCVVSDWSATLPSRPSGCFPSPAVRLPWRSARPTWPAV